MLNPAWNVGGEISFGRSLTPTFGLGNYVELVAKTMQKKNLAFWVLGAGLLGIPLVAEAVPTVKLELPLNRVAYQDNEPIELAVVRMTQPHSRRACCPCL